MSNLVLLNGGKNIPNRSLMSVLYNWLLSKFHVHHWQDEKIMDRYSNDKRIGIIQIQLCKEAGCGQRRSQIIGYGGIE